jgi:transposase
MTIPSSGRSAVRSPRQLVRLGPVSDGSVVGSGGCLFLDGELAWSAATNFTDQAWAEIAPLLPASGRPGGQWADHRRVINGILWKLATGVPWRDLPERYGPWQTCSERFRRWQADGTWQRLLAHAQTRSDAVGEVDWDVVVDATIVRAHQHAAGAQQGDPQAT